MAPTLTLDSVVKVPLSLHGLLGHDLKQVVGVGDDLCADSKWRSFRIDCFFYCAGSVKSCPCLVRGRVEATPYHVPGELHQGASQKEGVVDLLPIQIGEDCGQAGANIMHHHVLEKSEPCCY